MSLLIPTLANPKLDREHAYLAIHARHGEYNFCWAGYTTTKVPQLTCSKASSLVQPPSSVVDGYYCALRRSYQSWSLSRQKRTRLLQKGGSGWRK